MILAVGLAMAGRLRQAQPVSLLEVKCTISSSVSPSLDSRQAHSWTKTRRLPEHFATHLQITELGLELVAVSTE